MKERPVIGVSGSMMLDQGGMFPGYRRAYINYDYMRSVEENGGLPLMLPCLYEAEHPEEALERYAGLIDGLILSGGHDLFPPYYGAECRQKLTEVWPRRDELEHQLLDLLIAQSKPVFGICRGFQLINAHFGAQVIQDLSYAPQELLKHWQGHSPTLKTHAVQIEAGNPIYDCFGSKTLVNSFHHQVILETGKEMEVLARSSDGVIEAVRHKELPIYAVQWHPEMLSGVCAETAQLFAWFISQAARKN